MVGFGGIKWVEPHQCAKALKPSHNSAMQQGANAQTKRFCYACALFSTCSYANSVEACNKFMPRFASA
jgi:hypothetical protein